MFDNLFGNSSAEKVLLYLAAFEEGYAQSIAKNFNIPVNMVQKQLQKLERAGILVSQLKGRTRLYLWNPRYPFRQELRALLKKGLEYLPDSERKAYFMERKRPRRAGKPL